MWLKNRRHLYTRWTNCEGGLRFPQDKLVNWNALSFQPDPDDRPIPAQLFYHGSFRKDRLRSFEKYFTNGMPIRLATFRGASAKFAQLCGEGVALVPPIDLRDIRPMGLSLYLEDESTHRIYHHPATRFYEALSRRAPMIFDEACKPTFDRAGIDISPWLVSSSDDVTRFLADNDLRDVAQAQWDLWTDNGRKDFAAEVFEQVKQYYAELTVKV
jgi:hypothetical protein